MQYTLFSRMPFSALSISSLRIDRNAVSVLVAPVGAEMRILLLLWMCITP